MMKTTLTFLAIAVAVVAADDSNKPQTEVPKPRVQFTTDLGDFIVELEPELAPKTVANFLTYVDKKLYERGSFHRAVTKDNQPHNAVKIEVIQAAADPKREKHFAPAIPLERTSKTKLKHLAGTISMARDGPDTARD